MGSYDVNIDGQIDQLWDHNDWKFLTFFFHYYDYDVKGVKEKVLAPEIFEQLHRQQQASRKAYKKKLAEEEKAKQK